MPRLLTLLVCLCCLPTFALAQGIVINEVVYDSDGTDIDTWLELKGPGGASLDGYRVIGLNGNGGLLYQEILLTGMTIPADGYFLITEDPARPESDMSNANVDYQNGPDSILLQQQDAQMLWITIDAVGYETHGASDVFGGEGSPCVGQNPPNSMARCPDGSDTQDNSIDFIQDPNPTPGFPNQGVCGVLGACCFIDGSCQLLSEDNCVTQNGTYQGDGTACEPVNPCTPVEPTDYTLCEISEDDPVTGRPVHEGEFVRVSGVALMESNVWAANRVEFTITDGSCCTNVFYGGGATPFVQRGDQVEVIGTVGFFNGKTQITTPDLTITILSQGNPIPDPAVVSTFELSVNGEAYESCLLKLECITIVGGTWPLNEGDEANLTVDDGSGPVTLRIDRDTNIDGNPAPTGPWSAIGIASQFDSSDPYSEGYQLVLRDIDDVLYNDCLPATGACCFEDGHCEMLTADECGQVGGVYQGDDIPCEPDNPCPQPPPMAACCVNGVCSVATEAACAEAGGIWFPDVPNCEPPFQCPPVATETTSWGRIKADYR